MTANTDSTATTSNGSQVREWAKAHNVDAGGKRGRLPKETIAAFDKAHPKAPYAAGTRSDGMVKVSGSREVSNGKGGTRKVPFSRQVNVTEARAWGNSNGFTLGERGRIPAEVLKAFAIAQAESAPKGKAKAKPAKKAAAPKAAKPVEVADKA